MFYRIDQLQISGIKGGCISATVLRRDLFNAGDGALVLSMGDESVVIDHDAATALAKFLTDFDPKSNPNGPATRKEAARIEARKGQA